jgi:3-methyladenine DNA glycosylase AlkD
MGTRAVEVLERLKSLTNPDNIAGMARYGINTQNAYGISIYALRDIAREIGRDHALADELWASGIHEARILASYIADPLQMSEAQMERWAADFDSWDVCDQVCGLFEETPYAYQKTVEWSKREEEFVKRAAFAIMAGLVVHDKQASDERFEAFLPIIIAQAEDSRNYVKKAVNWALRNIQQIDSRAARWIASDALRELKSEKVQRRLKS